MSSLFKNCSLAEAIYLLIRLKSPSCEIQILMEMVETAKRKYHRHRKITLERVSSYLLVIPLFLLEQSFRNFPSPFMGKF